MRDNVINRESLKFNFLKKVIVRLDFQRVLDSQMGNFLDIVKPYLSEMGFNRYCSKSLAPDTSAAKLSATPSDPIPPDLAKEKTIHSFFNEDKGLAVDLSDQFIVLNLSSSKYIPFEYYTSIFLNIVKLYRANFTYFDEKRFGIRKINTCLVDDKELINDYFCRDYLHYYDSLDNIDSLISSSTDNFTVNSYNINFNRSIHKGTAADQTIYQVSIDIDAYSQNVHLINTLLYSEGALDCINNIIFDIFTSSLTPALLSELSSNEFTLPGLIGVETNE